MAVLLLAWPIRVVEVYLLAAVLYSISPVVVCTATLHNWWWYVCGKWHPDEHHQTAAFMTTPHVRMMGVWVLVKRLVLLSLCFAGMFRLAALTCVFGFAWV